MKNNKNKTRINIEGFQTEQEKFWAGKFGEEYITRNQERTYLANNIALFGKILARTNRVDSVIEFGANIGINLLAIKQLIPELELSAIEINEKAVDTLNKLEKIKVYHQSALDFMPDYERDLVLSKGFLIHVNPDKLSQIYDLLYQSSCHYICLAEYYSPTPVEVNYRGYEDKLFKRDFAGEMLDRFNNLQLVDYGFIYHRDNQFPQDDINWFLLEKIDCR